MNKTHQQSTECRCHEQPDFVRTVCSYCRSQNPTPQDDEWRELKERFFISEQWISAGIKKYDELGYEKMKNFIKSNFIPKYKIENVIGTMETYIKKEEWIHLDGQALKELREELLK